MENSPKNTNIIRGIDIKNIPLTPLEKFNTEEMIQMLASEGFTEKEIKKITRSFKQLPIDKLEELNTLYNAIKDDNELLITTHRAMLNLKNPVVSTVFSVFLGLFGIDRFYIEDKSSGLTKLLSLGCLTVFWFYDMFAISKRTKYKNYLKLKKVMGFKEEEFDFDKLNQIN